MALPLGRVIIIEGNNMSEVFINETVHGHYVAIRTDEGTVERTSPVFRSYENAVGWMFDYNVCTDDISEEGLTEVFRDLDIRV
jgi:hypothetical protein